MTIRDSGMNRRLSNLETCAERAPEGTYDDAKAVVTVMNDAMDYIEDSLRRAGLRAGGCDEARNLHVALYAYILARNPDHCGVIVGEGFGEHVDRISGRDLVAEAAASRDAIAQARAALRG